VAELVSSLRGEKSGIQRKVLQKKKKPPQLRLVRDLRKHPITHLAEVIQWRKKDSVWGPDILSKTTKRGLGFKPRSLQGSENGKKEKNSLTLRRKGLHFYRSSLSSRRDNTCTPSNGYWKVSETAFERKNERVPQLGAALILCFRGRVESGRSDQVRYGRRLEKKNLEK